MIQRCEAIVRLLHDDDPATLALVKRQLVLRGADALDELRSLFASADSVARVHLREVISTIEANEADSVFARFCAQFGEDGDVEEAAWRLAATFFPGEDLARQKRQLEDWGSEVAARLRRAGTNSDRIETLVEFLGHEMRLRGNKEDYYNINNSLLPEVIDTRTGIPITLSLVYMLVGRRAGLTLHGVGLPGHFIVRFGEHFFDPFHGGERVGLERCRFLVQKQDQMLTVQHLLPVTSQQMLARMLRNIHAIAAPSDPPLAAKVRGWIEKLCGD